MTEILATIVVVVIGYIIYKKRLASIKPRSRQEEFIERNADNLTHIKDTDAFWGVFIDYDNELLCCKSVLQLEKKHFVKKITPPLPLNGCDRNLCRCFYVGLVEKRDNTRRTHYDRREEIRFEENNDRRSRDERRSGMWEHHEE